MAEPSEPQSMQPDASHATPWSVTNDFRLALRVRDADKYPAKAHARRVAEKLRATEGLIALAGTKNENWPNSDMPAPFRQDREFYYLTGCNEPDCYVTYSIEHDDLTLWLPPVDGDPIHVIYYGNGSTVEEALEKYDIDQARYIDKPKDSETLSALAWFSHIKWLDTGLASTMFNTIVRGVRDEGWIESRASKMPIFLLNEQYVSKKGERESKAGLRTALHACRVIKDKYEIELIRRANAITAEAHVSVFQGMGKFASEADVEAAYMQICIARRAKEQAYDPIVGSGANASVLHYSENLADFGDGQTVVLDAGCEFEHYASDVTRTIPINKKSPGHWPSKEAKAIYDLVDKIQEACINQMKPGHRYIESTFTAHKMVTEGLLELGILTNSVPLDVLILSGISRYFLPHGLGHHLGLDVHDVAPPSPPPPAPQTWDRENLSQLREAYTQWSSSPASVIAKIGVIDPGQFGITKSSHMSVDGPSAPVLEPGMVVTVEPGIYFNKLLMKNLLGKKGVSTWIDKEVLARYIPVGGVRIEDDILITKTGYENLTTAPKGEEMLKIIRESASKSS